MTGYVAASLASTREKTVPNPFQNCDNQKRLQGNLPNGPMAPDTGGPRSIPGQGTRSHKLQLRPSVAK